MKGLQFDINANALSNKSDTREESARDRES
jgi:hypothetical protein